MPPYMIRNGATLKLIKASVCCLTLDNQVSTLTDAVRLCYSPVGKDFVSVDIKYGQHIFTYGWEETSNGEAVWFAGSADWTMGLSELGSLVDGMVWGMMRQGQLDLSCQFTVFSSKSSTHTSEYHLSNSQAHSACCMWWWCWLLEGLSPPVLKYNWVQLHCNSSKAKVPKHMVILRIYQIISAVKLIARTWS